MAKIKKADFSKPAPIVHKKKQETPVSEIPTPIDAFELWLTTNWKTAVIILAVIVLAIVGFVVARYSMAQADLRIRTEISDAKEIATLEKLIASYQNHPAVFMACEKLAAKYIEAKDYAKAYDTLKKIANNPSIDLFVRTRAALDSAGILELQNNAADAVKEFDAIASNMTLNESQRAEAIYSSARISWSAGDKEKALNTLEAINASRAYSNPDDPYAFWAQKTLELKDMINAPAAPAVEAPAAAKAGKPAAEAPVKAAAKAEKPAAKAPAKAAAAKAGKPAAEAPAKAAAAKAGKPAAEAPAKAAAPQEK